MGFRHGSLAAEIDRVGDLGVTDGDAPPAPLLVAEMDAPQPFHPHNTAALFDLTAEIGVLKPRIERKPLVKGDAFKR